MKMSSYLIAIIFALLFLAGLVPAQKNIDAEKEEVVKEAIPEGMVEAAKPVWGRFAESATKDPTGNAVVLYKEDRSIKPYGGKVLVPMGFEAWDNYPIPTPQDTWSMMDPIAIFFANTDGDPDNELLIIDECYTGIGPTGARPFYRTRVYDFNGMGFVHRDELSEKIGNLKTAAQVRAKLRQMGASLRKYKTQMFAMEDTAELNEKIRVGSEAGEAWVKDPQQIVYKATGEFSDALSRTIEMSVPYADGSSSMTVTVTDDGLADDSVSSVRYRFELAKDEKDVWSLVSAGKAWKCQRNRGSQVFSTAKCL